MMIPNELDIPKSQKLRHYDIEQLNALAADIRKRLIDVTSKNGGHLASSLGAVELIVALHHIYNFPKDKLVFDVGHQSYAHKLLTGRAELFDTLRSFGGISGFTRREESPYDVHDSGHASDALSIALGLALARDLRGGDERVVALVGDAALSGGMAFEALNQIGQLGTDLTIVLNDNEMSIAHNVGALSLYLGKARVSRPYTTLRDGVEDLVGSAGRVGRFLVNAGETAKESFKKLMVPGTLFEDIGIIYIGPIDGHNIEMVNKALRVSNKAVGPVLIHMVTQKGRGFAPAELQPEVFHGIGSFDPETGRIASKNKGSEPSFTEVLSQALLDEASTNDDIVAITAAMEDGTGLAAFKDVYPDRFVDVGIAEEHAVALAGGLALGGKLPVVAIYSTFLQRAYDQIIINVALQRQHVVFCVDRGGLVGEDGSTHHGIFDLAYLRSVPNMRILAPADRQQLRDALHTALALKDGPVALRYPRGEAPVPTGAGGYPEEDREPVNLPIGKAIKRREGGDVSILAIGRMLGAAEQAAQILAEQGVQAAVYNMLWVKPLDQQAVAEAATAPLLVTIEDGTVSGGFGSAVLEALAGLGVSDATETSLGADSYQADDACDPHTLHTLSNSPSAGDALGASGGCPAKPRLLNIGIPDQFVQHGSVGKLFEQLEMTAPQIAKRISDAIKRETTSD